MVDALFYKLINFAIACNGNNYPKTLWIRIY
jgi:hypothetical protein